METVVLNVHKMTSSHICLFIQNKCRKDRPETNEIGYLQEV